MMNESESPELIAKKNLFEIWSKGADFQRLRERERIKIPGRITWLPCGCVRDQGNENDMNESWNLHHKKGSSSYKHRQCGKEFIISSPNS